MTACIDLNFSRGKGHYVATHESHEGLAEFLAEVALAEPSARAVVFPVERDGTNYIAFQCGKVLSVMPLHEAAVAANTLNEHLYDCKDANCLLHQTAPNLIMYIRAILNRAYRNSNHRNGV